MARRISAKNRVTQAATPTNGMAPNGKLVSAATAQRGIIDVVNKDRQFFQLMGELTPSGLAGILKQALIGNLVWQERLFQKMEDEWPRLQKNMQSLKRDISDLEWNIEPYTEKGSPPTDTAIAKAELADRALHGMEGDPTLDQSDFIETIKDVVDAACRGFCVSEIYWTVKDGEIVPQCTRKIPARFYGYGLAPEQTDRLMLNPKGDLAFTWQNLSPFPENKFIVAICKGYSNHPTLAPMLRSLTPWYFAQKYGLKWFLNFAQMFGSPMRMAEYTPGDDTTFNMLTNMLEQMGTSNWGVFPAGAEVKLLETKTSNGTLLPQRVLIDDADQQCDIMILGQTLTSSVRMSGGNRALGQVHADTERHVLNGVSKFVRMVIKRQLIRPIIMLNYGECSECPELEGDIEEPVDELIMAQRDQILLGQMGLPVEKDFLYDRHSIPEPGEGAELYSPPVVGPDNRFGVSQPFGATPPNATITSNPKPPNSRSAANASEHLPPDVVSFAAKRGIDQRQQAGRGGSLAALTRARDLAQKKPLSIGTIQRMRQYFDSHPEDEKAGTYSAGAISYLLHGGSAGRHWVNSICKEGA